MGKSKASVNQNQPSSKLGMADVRKKVKQKKIKIMHPKSRKAARVQRSLLRDDKMARQKQVAKGDALLKGERIAWLKEEMVEGKAQYTYGEMAGLIQKYISRFQEELASIHADDKARGRRTNPSREAAIILQHRNESAEFVAGWSYPDLRIPKVVLQMQAWNYEINLITAMRHSKFTLKT